VKVGTSGDGGRKIRETVRIITNDPRKQGMNVVITGKVENFYIIEPFMSNAKGGLHK